MALVQTKPAKTSDIYGRSRFSDEINIQLEQVVKAFAQSGEDAIEVICAEIDAHNTQTRLNKIIKMIGLQKTIRTSYRTIQYPYSNHVYLVRRGTEA